LRAQIRWSAWFAGALAAVVRNLQVVFRHLDSLRAESSVRGSKAIGLLRQLLSIRMIRWIFFLCDVFEVESVFSKQTQSEGLTICELPEHIDTVRNNLSVLSHDVFSGAHMQALNKLLTGSSFCGWGARADQSHEQFVAEASQYVAALIDSLSTRFPDNDLVRAASIFDPTFLPSAGDKKLYSRYGLDQLTTLLDRFSDVDGNEVRNEWPLFKEVLSNHYRGFRAADAWRCLLTSEGWSQKFPSVLKLLRIVMTIPVSAAGPERRHRERTNTKTANRSSMSLDLLNDLMMVLVIYC
jgi:hypothetical protein